MRLDQYFRPFSASARAALVTVTLFASGMPLSAFGQPPAAQPPAVPAAPAAAATDVAVQGTPLAIDDAVRMALENNLGVQAERLNPQIAVLGVSQARGAWAPALFSSTTKSSNTTPPVDFNTATNIQEIQTNGNFSTQGGIQQLTKWGGNYSLALDGSRAITNQSNVVFNPQLGSHLNFNATQPLLRNFRIDSARQQYLQAINQQQASDLGLQQRIVQTSRNVRAAYYNLLGAIAGLEVAQQSLDLARESLKNNQTRVEVGTMAPIDIVAAEAEVASNEEAVIIQQAAIETAQDQLRALVMNPSMPDFWSARFKPTERPTMATQAIDVDAAVKNALEHRTDILQFKKRMESTDISMRYAANQKLPQVDVSALYGLTGIAGTQLSREEGSPATIRSFGNALSDVFGNNYRRWSVTLNVSYPIGTSPADAAFASAKLQHQQEVTSLADLQMQVTTSVREAGRQVETNLRRVEATKKARELAEKRLEAEQKRFQVGLNSTFELFQAQRDLARARNAELNATIAYNQSLVDFEAVQTAPIR
jgi:outer membrane protein